MNQTAEEKMLSSNGQPNTQVYQPSDDELVTLVCAGETAAFTLLFERYRHYVARLAYRFFQRREQVEEVIQQSFVTAYFSLGSFRGGNQMSFVAWLSRITIRTCYDELRRIYRRAESQYDNLTEDEVSRLNKRLQDLRTGDDVEGAMISRDLATKLLARLSPEDRMVLTLFNLENYTVAEIAEAMGWSVPKVKVRASRAREALRRVLYKFL